MDREPQRKPTWSPGWLALLVRALVGIAGSVAVAELGAPGARRGPSRVEPLLNANRVGGHEALLFSPLNAGRLR